MTAELTGRVAAAEAQPSGMFASLSNRSFAKLWAAGWMWNLTRWLGVFTGAYLVDQKTESPLLAQLVGVLYWSPMFIGGIVAGGISDRFDRRRTILRQLTAVIPVAFAMTAVVAAGRLEVWMVYVYAVCIGIGSVVDLTNRRALVYDVADRHLITNAMALEAFSMSAGTAIGTFCGGAVIDLVGPWFVYFLIGVCYVTGLVLMTRVPAPPPKPAAPAAPTPGDAPRKGLRVFVAELAEGLRALPANKTLVSLLGVTFLVNLLYFPFMTLVPTFGRLMGVSGTATGLLSASGNVGAAFGALVLAKVQPTRRGAMYVGGSMFALVLLVAFANAGSYRLALAALMCCGLGTACFGSFQAALCMSVTDEHLRGRAMGLLTMAIGALPFGNFMMGSVAEWLSPSAAVTASATTGVVLLALWLWRRPEIVRAP
ncbi:MAG: MFS transporter [Acidimicrobiales bacterium]